MKDKELPEGLSIKSSTTSTRFCFAKTNIDNWMLAGPLIFKRSEGRSKPAQDDTAACLDWVQTHRFNCRWWSSY
jgi:hypothetical protein